MNHSPTRRILVVDDEEDIRDTLSEILGRAGYDVDLATSGSEAIGRVRDGTYDVVLSDVRMPGMTGMELYHHVVEAKPELAGRFIVLTGEDPSGPLQAFLHETGVRLIEKPFVPLDVRRCVAAAADASG